MPTPPPPNPPTPPTPPRKPASAATPAPQVRAKKRQPAGKQGKRALRVLLVRVQGGDSDELSIVLQKRHVECTQAKSVNEARCLARQYPYDVVVVDAELPDGCGITFAGEASRRVSPAPQTIVLAARRSYQTAIHAMRLGISDLLVAPVTADEFAERIDHAIERVRSERRRRRRYQRLRKACHEMHRSREEVGKQVDVLCQDLVVAYQELAQQMQQVVYASEFTTLIKQELDLEQLLRRVLEYIVEKAGPTNAAIFLPANAHEYTLGGYVNYDTVSGSPEVLLDHLADVAVPAVADHEGVLLLDDNHALQQWLGDDATHLEDCHVLTATGRHDDEALAVIMLFRDGETPFSAETVEAIETITPLLADHLARIIRVHHRHIPDEPGEQNDYNSFAA